MGCSRQARKTQIKSKRVSHVTCPCACLASPQMWRYEGSRTLHYYLRRRDTLRALASDLEVAEEAVVATVMKQIFEALAVRVYTHTHAHTDTQEYEGRAKQQRCSKVTERERVSAAREDSRVCVCVCVCVRSHSMQRVWSTETSSHSTLCSPRT